MENLTTIIFIVFAFVTFVVSIRLILVWRTFFDIYLSNEKYQKKLNEYFSKNIEMISGNILDDDKYTDVGNQKNETKTI